MERPPGRDELLGGSADDAPAPRRRRWWGLAGAAAVAITLAVTQPGLSLHADGPTPDPTALPTGAPTGSALEIVAWDTRGDLARDRGFLGAAVARVREERPEIARIFFAGRLPDGGRLVLAGSDVFRGVVATAVHALVVEPGVAVAEAPVTELTALTDPQQVLAWAGHGATGHVYLVALSRPGPVSFELSPNVRFSAQGTPSRMWTPVYTEDGVFVADLGTDVDPVVTVRATGPGVFPQAEVVHVARAAGARPATALTVAGTSSPAYQGPDPELLAGGLRQSAGSLADLDASRLRVLWSGVPWKLRRLALVLISRPDGVRLQALVGQQGDSEFPAGVRALPRGAPDTLPWLMEPFSPEDPTFLLCPTGPGTVVYHRAGQPERRLAVHESGAVVLVDPGPGAPSASGADVTLLDPKGRRLLTTRLPDPGFDDPLLLDQG